MEIRSKRQFFEMWEAGLLGNRTRIWRDPMEAMNWGLSRAKLLPLQPDGRYSDLPEIGFRQIGKSGGGAWEKVPWWKVYTTALRWTAEGRTFIMDDGAPDDCRTLQGEVVRTYKGLEGFLDTVGKLPMRPAMAAGHMRHCSGSVVRALLDRFMDPNSRDDLDAILDLFPDAAVEFSCFGRNVGVFPRRNTLFWEVRNY